MNFTNFENLDKDMKHMRDLFDALVNLMEKKIMISNNSDSVRIKKDNLICLITLIAK